MQLQLGEIGRKIYPPLLRRATGVETGPNQGGRNLRLQEDTNWAKGYLCGGPLANKDRLPRIIPTYYTLTGVNKTSSRGGSTAEINKGTENKAEREESS